MRRRTVLAVLAGLAVAAAGGFDWPGWRGPRGDGRSPEPHFPLHWGPTQNVQWKAEVPGQGHSSPVVWGDRVFLTTCLEDAPGPVKPRQLLCYDRRDGRPLWQRTVVTAPLEPKHTENSYASSTPATDGRHIWVTFLDLPRIRVACYDLDGRRVWETSPGNFNSRHGFCSSPVLYQDLVIVNCDQDDQEAFIVALDKATGRERWRADRPNRTRSYCVPIVVEAGGRPQLVLSGSKCIASYDPHSGKQWWVIDGPTEQYVASLVYRNGVLFLTAGYPELHLMGIDPTQTGNVTHSAVLWHDRRNAAYVPSPVAEGDCFFVVSDNGVASCWDVKTGLRHWSERLGKHHHASAVAAGGHIYFPADDGVTYVLKAGPKFELVAKNPLGEEVYGSPALAGGAIFLRGRHHLFCVAEPASPAQR
jgi:outer membrane protein assembly factor BamB